MISWLELKMYNALAKRFAGKTCQQICASDKIRDGIGQCCQTAAVLPPIPNVCVHGIILSWPLSRELIPISDHHIQIRQTHRTLAKKFL